MLRILVFGSGAVGTLLGGLLANEGHEVVFVGRSWNVEAIRTKGIRISGLWGNHTVAPQPAYESPDEIPEDRRIFDFILIATKAFATGEAIDACMPLLEGATRVVSVQNGYGNCQRIASKAGWDRTLGARFITGVEIPAPGEVNVTVHGDDVRLGHYLNEFPAHEIESIAMTLREAGIPVSATDQLEQYIWAKIVYNAALNPLGALLGATYGELAENPHTRRLMDAVMDEAFAITKAHGIRQFWDSAEDYRHAFYEKMIPPTAAHYPSMLRDLEKGRRTEIGSLNGAIACLGAEKHIPAPVNTNLFELVRFRETRKVP